MSRSSALGDLIVAGPGSRADQPLLASFCEARSLQANSPLAFALIYDSEAQSIVKCLSLSIVRLVMQPDSRTVLREALIQARSGVVDVDRTLLTIGNPQELSLIEKSAWLQIHNWAADTSLRNQFPSHAAFSDRRLRDLLEWL